LTFVEFHIVTTLVSYWDIFTPFVTNTFR